MLFSFLTSSSMMTISTGHDSNLCFELLETCVHGIKAFGHAIKAFGRALRQGQVVERNVPVGRVVQMLVLHNALIIP